MRHDGQTYICILARQMVLSALTLFLPLAILHLSLYAQDEKSAVDRSSLCPPPNTLPIPLFGNVPGPEIVAPPETVPPLKSVLPLPPQARQAAAEFRASPEAAEEHASVWSQVVFTQRVVVGVDALRAPEIQSAEIPETADNSASTEKMVTSGLFVLPRMDAPAGQGYFEVVLPKGISKDADSLRAIVQSVSQRLTAVDKEMVTLALKHKITVYDIRDLANESFAANAHANAALQERLGQMGGVGQTFEGLRRNAFWQVSQTTIGRFTEFSSDGHAIVRDDTKTLNLACVELDEIQNEIQKIKTDLTSFILNVINNQ